LRQLLSTEWLIPKMRKMMQVIQLLKPGDLVNMPKINLSPDGSSTLKKENPSMQKLPRDRLEEKFLTSKTKMTMIWLLPLTRLKIRLSLRRRKLLLNTKRTKLPKKRLLKMLS